VWLTGVAAASSFPWQEGKSEKKRQAAETALSLSLGNATIRTLCLLCLSYNGRSVIGSSLIVGVRFRNCVFEKNPITPNPDVWVGAARAHRVGLTVAAFWETKPPFMGRKIQKFNALSNRANCLDS
jgi:hypothetical protein